MKRLAITLVLAGILLTAATASARTYIGATGCYAEGWKPAVVSTTATTATYRNYADVGGCPRLYWVAVNACMQRAPTTSGPWSNVVCVYPDPVWGYSTTVQFSATVPRGSGYVRGVGVGKVFTGGLTASATTAYDISYPLAVN